MEPGLVGVNIAVLAVSDKPAITDEPSAKLIIDRLGEIGHRVVAREVVRDTEQLIRAQLLMWIADPNVDVVIATTDSDAAGDALEPLVTKSLRGFSDLFRLISYQEIGTAAMLVDAEAAQCGSTYVFLLPASLGAVRTALDKILIPQLDQRTKPRNLAARFKRTEQPPLQPPSKIAIETPPAGMQTMPLPVLATKPSVATPPAGSPLVKPAIATPPAGSPLVKPSSIATPPAGLPITKPASAVTPPAGFPVTKPASAVTAPAGFPITKPASAVTPPAGLPITKPASAVTPPAGLPVTKPASAVTPPAGLPVTKLPSAPPPRAGVLQTQPLPTLAPPPAKPAAGVPSVSPADSTQPTGPINSQAQKLPLSGVPTTTTGETTNVGSAPSRPAGLPPMPPGASSAHPTGAIPLLPLTQLRDEAPPKRSSSPTPPPPPPRSATPTPPPPPPRSKSPTPPPPLPKSLPKAMTSVPQVMTGEITTLGDVSVFTGDAFVEPKRRKKRGVMIWLGLVFASATAATILFMTYRDPDRQASAAKAPEIRHEIKPPEIEPPREVRPPEHIAAPVEPTPEITAPTPEVKTPVPPAPPPTTAATLPPQKPALKVVATRSTPTPTPRRPTEHVVARQPPPALETPKPAKSKAPALPPEPPAAEGCDEVSCVLDRYDRPCCERYKPAAKNFTPGAGIPESLDRSMVVAGIDKMRPVVIRCGEIHSATGTVKLAIKVDADGRISEISVTTTPDAGLGDCVAAAIRKARFPKTETGGSFIYPFVF